MRAEFSNITIDGVRLHRMTLHPPKNVPEVGACIFSHGQGDYAERYQDVLHPFTERGIRCIATDLQGHGRSDGKRGHVGSTSFIDQIIQSNLAATESLPTGIAGHSMGGLLTLRHLALSLTGALPMPEYCWVNAPLLYPANGRSDWFVRLALFFASITPLTTIHTGVTPDMCRLPDGCDGKLPKDPFALGHQKISLGWGTHLLKISEMMHQVLSSKVYSKPFLFTQGTADVVCPPDLAQSFFNKLNWPDASFKSFEGMRHETFAESGREQLFSTIGEWLDASSIKLEPATHK